MNARRWLVVGGVAIALAVTSGGAFAGTATPPEAAAVSPDRTSAAESRKVDAVPTPRLTWAACFEIAECATVALPLDYDQPRGATTDVGVLRIKARDQANRIGSLFVNPGGPGLSATEYALVAPLFMSDELLDRFDIVGVDPRGIDGVLDARAWVGNTRQILDERTDSSGGASRTLTEILRRCDRAGEKACPFAEGDPVRTFDTITRERKAKPLVIADQSITYLLTGKPPARDTVCADAPAPFSGQGQTFAERRGKRLPPVAAPRSVLTVR